MLYECRVGVVEKKNAATVRTETDEAVRREPRRRCVRATRPNRTCRVISRARAVNYPSKRIRLRMLRFFSHVNLTTHHAMSARLSKNRLTDQSYRPGDSSHTVVGRLLNFFFVDNWSCNVGLKTLNNSRLITNNEHCVWITEQTFRTGPTNLLRNARTRKYGLTTFNRERIRTTEETITRIWYKKQMDTIESNWQDTMDARYINSRVDHRVNRLILRRRNTIFPKSFTIDAIKRTLRQTLFFEK